MLRSFGFGGKKSAPHKPSNAEENKLLADEGVELERALIAMDAVLDGQIDYATKLTTHDDKVYTKIATGVLRFIEATVSFETDAIMKAVDALSISESAANSMKNAAQSANVITTRYRPGAEFELVEYESSLLAAISMLLTEGKLEILKALYKIRKTYLALEELRKHIYSVNPNVREGVAETPSVVPQGVSLGEFEELHRQRTERLSVPSAGSPSSTIEEYIQSGVDSMCGLLHLILSSVPPTIQKLLSVVGLSGDRETSLEMLWRSSSTYRNIHGSLALIALIMFFDSQLQYKDIQLSPEDELAISKKFDDERNSLATVQSSKNNSFVGKTTERLTPKELRDTESRLLVDLRNQREYYPHGVLWLLQQGRLIAHKNLLNGVNILESDECGPNQMRQVEGLLMFDRTMFLLSLDRLEKASEDFIKLKDVSSWSHPLYMYLSAACQLELYRRSEDQASPEALKHKKLATERFEKALTVGGKKKVLGRKMPFDGYVIRKVEGFKSVAARKKVDLVDAITTSPFYEALYFWNGNARMSPELSEAAYKNLLYSVSDRAKVSESEEDKFTRQVLEAAYLRGTEQKEKGYELAEKLAKMVSPTETAGKKNCHALGEPWAGPAALYERAIYEWVKYGPDHARRVRKFLALCSDWDGDYELSTRIGMKVTGANDRLGIYRL